MLFLTVLHQISSCRKIPLAFGLVGLLIVGVNPGCAQQATSQIIRTADAPPFERQEWVNRPWSDIGMPYAQARTDLDKEPATLAVVQRYQSQAFKDPQDALSLFRWAYISEKAAAQTYNEDRQNNLLSGTWRALTALPLSKTPKTYEFARVRYLIDTRKATTGPYSYQLRELGDRLLRQNPKDFAVKFRQMELLRTNSSVNVQIQRANLATALRYAQELVRDYPDVPKTHRFLGNMYASRASKLKSRKLYGFALGEYRRYLQLADKSDPARQWVPSDMETISRELKKLPPS